MRIVLARLLWNFDLVRLSPESEDWANQNVYLLWYAPVFILSECVFFDKYTDPKL